MAIKYLDAKRIRGTAAERLAMSGDTANAADFTEDFSETTPTSWSEEHTDSNYLNSLRPYKDSTNGLHFDLDYNSSLSLVGTLDMQNASLLDGNINNTKWTMRFKVNFTGGSSGSGTAWVGFSDSNYATATAQRFAGCRLNISAGMSNGSDNSGQAMTVGNRTDGGTTSITSSTDYYITVERQDANTLVTTIRLTSHTTTPTATHTATTLETATDDLRYWKIMNHMAGSSGSIGGRIYDLQIWNNRDVSTPFYPNLPAGTIFEQTDDYKYYIWDGTDTWTVMVAN